jgi:hypothetical protein
MKLGEVRSDEQMCWLMDMREWRVGLFTFIHPRCGRCTFERYEVAGVSPDRLFRWVLVECDKEDEDSNNSSAMFNSVRKDLR